MKTEIKIQNLKCGGCANTIIKKASNIEGGAEVDVNIETNSIAFYVSNEEAIISVTKQLKVLGYPSVEDSNSVLSKAKSFVSCASGRINK